jgi:N-methylhydantoinase A
MRVGKVATSGDDPAAGVLRALQSTLGGDSLASASAFSHGTTVALNAILQGRGASVGLLCTAGFRDVVEIRRGTHEDAFDVLWRPRSPLVERWARVSVRERVRGDGSVLLPLHEADIERAIAEFQRQGVESIAVAFINAWANPVHEQRAADVIRSLGFEGELTLAHELSREYREYERTSTAVLNAYIRPLVSRYLRELKARLAEDEFGGDAYIMRSGGGAMPMREAEERPFEAIYSGPVAGAEAAAQVARMLALPTAVAVDVGGTSFDATLIADGAPPMLTAGRVADVPVQASWVDVRSIGAGGGSLAYVDQGGLLHVGPESAGSTPGPAAYGRGGTRATVTDAAVWLGMLGNRTLSDNVRLDLALAERALLPLAAQLDKSVEEVARGVLLISSSAMANAIREITVERGHDPREAPLIAFGGAGPLFATLLARELETGTIVIPPAAGNFSAWGLVGADVVRESAQTFVAPLTDEALAQADRLLTVLFAQLQERSNLRGAEPIASADLRYRGQEHPITLPLERAEKAAALAERFKQRYADVFLHRLEHEVELVALRAALRQRAPAGEWPAPERLAETAVACAHETFSFARGERQTFPVVERAALRHREPLLGGAIVIESTATTYVDVDFAARIDESGFLILEHRGEHW